MHPIEAHAIAAEIMEWYGTAPNTLKNSKGEICWVVPLIQADGTIERKEVLVSGFLKLTDACLAAVGDDRSPPFNMLEGHARSLREHGRIPRFRA